MGRVGRYVRLRAREGQCDVLVEHMLGVAQLLAKVPGCELYVINTSAADTNTVWVTEVWSTRAELDASLSIDGVKASVQQVATSERERAVVDLVVQVLLPGRSPGRSTSPSTPFKSTLETRLTRWEYEVAVPS